MKHKLINGWTIPRMIEAIKTNNTGKQCSFAGSCRYENPATDNHCAVGCFIPEAHDAMRSTGGVSIVMAAYPDLKEHLPLDSQGMFYMQAAHDDTLHVHTNNMHSILTTWIHANVTE